MAEWLVSVYETSGAVPATIVEADSADEALAAGDLGYGFECANCEGSAVHEVVVVALAHGAHFGRRERWERVPGGD